jgi:hypothetical protein
VSRNDPQQQPPAPNLDLSGFPSVLAPAGVVFRAFGTQHGPGYYSNRLTGRFDLSGDFGTMYFGDSIETAIRESLGDLAYGKVVMGSSVEEKAVAEAVLPVQGPFANISDERAVDFGVIRELQTMSDYTVPQAWAEKFRMAGFAGVRYPSRFTSGAAANSWAVFGPAGATDLEVSGHISGLAACQLAGIPTSGLSLPPRGSFTFVRDD